MTNKSQMNSPIVYSKKPMTFLKRFFLINLMNILFLSFGLYTVFSTIISRKDVQFWISLFFTTLFLLSLISSMRAIKYQIVSIQIDSECILFDYYKWGKREKVKVLREFVTTKLSPLFTYHKKCKLRFDFNNEKCIQYSHFEWDCNELLEIQNVLENEKVIVNKMGSVPPNKGQSI